MNIPAAEKLAHARGFVVGLLNAGVDANQAVKIASRLPKMVEGRFNRLKVASTALLNGRVPKCFAEEPAATT